MFGRTPFNALFFEERVLYITIVCLLWFVPFLVAMFIIHFTYVKLFLLIGVIGSYIGAVIGDIMDADKGIKRICFATLCWTFNLCWVSLLVVLFKDLIFTFL